jgi:hypothetical protein
MVGFGVVGCCLQLHIFAGSSLPYCAVVYACRYDLAACYYRPAACKIDLAA